MTTTPFLTSPLEACWTRLGATIVEAGHGWRVPDSFAGHDAEMRIARRAVVIGDDTPRGKFRLQGDGAQQQASDALGIAVTGTGVVCEARGADREDADRILQIEGVLLRPDLCHVGCEMDGQTQVLEVLTQSVGDSDTTVTDVTHGRFELRVVGPAAPVLLSKVCGLDVDSRAFPSGTAMQASVAKMAQLVIRSDLGELPAYRLVGGRALGAYVWDTLMEAGQELGVEPIGAQGLGMLTETTKP